MPRSDVTRLDSQSVSRQGWLAEHGGPRWKGGGSVYVMLYQPEVDCLTAVDGLHNDCCGVD